jgi:hypothetical protein
MNNAVDTALYQHLRYDPSWNTKDLTWAQIYTLLQEGLQMTPELLLAQLNRLKQGPDESPKLFANRFADMAKAAGLGKEASKNTLVLALNDHTNDVVNGQLMIHLRS